MDASDEKRLRLIRAIALIAALVQVFFVVWADGLCTTEFTF